MVTPYVKFQGVGWYSENIILKLFEVPDLQNHLLCLGIAEAEIAEAKMSGKQTVEIYTEFLGVLIDIVHFQSRILCRKSLYILGGLHYKRQVFVGITYGMKEFHTGLRIYLSITGETTVADDTQHVFLISGIYVPCLFIVTCQQHLRTTTHAKHLGSHSERLGSEVETLGKDVFIEVWQY